MPTAATAAVLRARGAPYALEPVVLAAIGPGQVRVRIHACGICFTDVGVQTYEQGLPLPQVLGHEGAGIVEAVGPGVTSVAAGDHVVLSYASCGACPSCSNAAPQYCANFMLLNYAGRLPDGRAPMVAAGQGEGGEIFGGFFGQSSFATHAIAYERNTVKVAASLDFATLAPFGCGMQTGAGTVYNSLKPRAGQSLVVMGTGSVGLAALMAAADLECTPLIAVDRNPDRLALATSLGATHTILADGADLAAAIRAIIPTGVDYIVDTTGVGPVIRAGTGALASRGQLAMLAVTPPGTEISINPNILLGGRALRGAVEGDADPQVFIPWLIARHRAGRFPHDRLITTYPFAEINAAVADMKSGKVVKPVLLMD
ncbi:aryl-alcohol dehydrogenase [Polymorphobacter glacialis]|uniref:Aryl-alcohol dehydrogenase n=1 Tax=Sandarakinorhabdus glacialis TaxID=1614636 RepID=A0A916ZYC1_9SPHN|nr:NAD(P)-dependent alcohol dehydrogenase [Polymorphobacter glacialis]GGE16899.1 aryl-alcohol dehydrogenase [Polymorphobacter glacialis]